MEDAELRRRLDEAIRPAIDDLLATARTTQARTMSMMLQLSAFLGDRPVARTSRERLQPFKSWRTSSN